jgi:hypothetical protein
MEMAQDRAMLTLTDPAYSKKTIRLPDDLWAKAQAQADLNGRSLNAEITARLNEVYAHPTLADLSEKQDETFRLIRQVLAELETLNIKRK